MSDGTYAECIEALMTALRTLTTYFPKDYQVSFNRADINRGAEYWFFVAPAGFPNTRLDGRDRIYQRQTLCDLCVRYKTDAESYPKLIAVLDDIDKLLRKPRVLKNINVIRPVLLSANGNVRQDVPGNSPNFLVQPLTVTIEQIVSI